MCRLADLQVGHTKTKNTVVRLVNAPMSTTQFRNLDLPNPSKQRVYKELKTVKSDALLQRKCQL